MKWRSRDPIEHLDDDIQDHIRRETEENIARGMAPDEAATAARRAFGNVTLTREAVRAVWIPLWWDQCVQDVRYAARLWRRAPAFSLVVALTLALGIGMNTAVFSVVNAVLMRPLAYPHAERLVWIAPSDDRGQDEVVMSPDFEAWRDQSTAFDRLAGFLTDTEPIDAVDEVIQARVAAVTEGFWELTGANFSLGGPPPPGQDGVVLPHTFFERWFRADATVIGRSVMLDGRQSVITGVLPADFHPQLVSPPTFIDSGGGDIDVYRANVIRPSAGPGVQILNVIGRLKPDVSIDRAREELERIRQLRRPTGDRGEAPRLRVIPYVDKIVGAARKPLIIVQAAVALVLLIVCVNTANLLLVRGWARQREIAIRTAIGAGRSRVLRQFFAESLLLSVIGCASGFLLARALTALMLHVMPLAVPRLAETTIDGSVVLFALGACAATTFVFTFVPAIAVWKTDVFERLKEGARSASSNVRTVHVRSALVAIEVALTVVLLVAAGLMVKSFWRMSAYPAGFDPDRILTMRIQFSGPRYGEPQNRRAYIDELLRRAGSVPGVKAAGVGSNGDSNMLLFIEGGPDVPPDQRPRGVLSAASGGYAAALGFRVVKGRWLTDHEPAPAFVVNETLARQAFPGVDPIGKRIDLPFVNASPRFGQVVGVVADLRYSNLGAAPEPELFLDYAHARMARMILTIRTDADPMSVAPALRTLLSGIDRSQPPSDVKPLDVALGDSIATRRSIFLLLDTFALAALLLVTIGIYGVVAYAVAQRTQEIGIRIALGATRRQVVAIVMRPGMVMTLGGIVLGLVAALMSTRLMTGLLYEVTATDLATFTTAVMIALGTAFGACLRPAVKASLIDPILALRSD
jgi:putative ABC transport system permease protein